MALGMVGGKIIPLELLPEGTVFLTEIPNKDDAIIGKLFSGASGKYFKKQIAQIGQWEPCSFISMNKRFPGTGSIQQWGVPKGEAPEGAFMLDRGIFSDTIRTKGMQEVLDAIKESKPKLVVAMGNIPNAALGGAWGIKQTRGAVYWSDVVDAKVLPMYSAGAVWRDYKLTPVMLTDLMRAKKEAALGRTMVRPEGVIRVPQAASEVRALTEELLCAKELSADIETIVLGGRKIDCVGFALSPTEAIVFPLLAVTEKTKEGKPKQVAQYWTDDDLELVMLSLKRIFETGPPIIFQNGAYDMTMLHEILGIRTLNYSDDTMLAMHNIHPGVAKDLGSLGTYFTSRPNWKKLRNAGGAKPEE